MPRLHSLSKGRVPLYVAHDLRDPFMKTLTPAERWAWIGLRLLTADCPHHPILCLSPGVPLTDAQIAQQLAVPLATWKSAKKKLKEAKRIEISKEGIAIGTWFLPSTKRRKWANVYHDEKEMDRTYKDRLKLCKVWEEITGLTPDPTNRLFVNAFMAREKDGMTLDQMELAIRTYANIILNGTFAQARLASISRALAGMVVWRLIKANRPVFGRMESTHEYFKSLPKGSSLRILAINIAKEYSDMLEKHKRSHGLAGAVDVDWNKVISFKEYLKDRMGYYENSKSNVWPKDLAQ